MHVLVALVLHAALVTPSVSAGMTARSIDRMRHVWQFLCIEFDGRHPSDF